MRRRWLPAWAWRSRSSPRARASRLRSRCRHVDQQLAQHGRRPRPGRRSIPNSSRRRSPIGILYPTCPARTRRSAARPRAAGNTAATIEVGGILNGGDLEPVLHPLPRRRAAARTSATSASMPTGARARSFVEAVGGAVGRDDQFYSLAFGRYNDWKLTAFYNETPSVFTTTYRSLWSGVGQRHLTLNGLTPGGARRRRRRRRPTSEARSRPRRRASSASSARRAACATTSRSATNWKLYASLHQRAARRIAALRHGVRRRRRRRQHREPGIDRLHTHDFLAGLHYSDPVQSFNLRASASLFRNDMRR